MIKFAHARRDRSAQSGGRRCRRQRGTHRRCDRGRTTRRGGPRRHARAFAVRVPTRRSAAATGVSRRLRQSGDLRSRHRVADHAFWWVFRSSRTESATTQWPSFATVAWPLSIASRCCPITPSSTSSAISLRVSDAVRLRRRRRSRRRGDLRGHLVPGAIAPRARGGRQAARGSQRLALSHAPAGAAPTHRLRARARNGFAHRLRQSRRRPGRAGVRRRVVRRRWERLAGATLPAWHETIALARVRRRAAASRCAASSTSASSPMSTRR